MSKIQGLLQWCKQCTQGYKDVNVNNFHLAWRDGLAFCALIHHFHPEAIDFDSLSKDNPEYNLKLAFETGEKLGVVSLLDVEDMIEGEKPDWQSVCTYVGEINRQFGKVSAVDEDIKKVEPKLEQRVKQERPKTMPLPQTYKPYTSAGPHVPQRGIICTKCHKVINHDAIEVLGKKYHVNCNMCSLCNKCVGTDFITLDDVVYCHECSKKVWMEKKQKKEQEQKQQQEQQEVTNVVTNRKAEVESKPEENTTVENKPVEVKAPAKSHTMLIITIIALVLLAAGGCVGALWYKNL